ncbi:E3 ubiquitin-protein ligase RNF123-like isoform X2 [Ceratina calcarata]|uniref:E3 ubiquitin-protein ligase RNF123-like isoform X2 n=1 Tax=Ceratina calcarata TaxID=156304 RepID=A0AAJ7J549_9HYME|nr:E3 ubiquitin-protein ligase RNF123-like isoform X2 [Ceratina calcarata]
MDIVDILREIFGLGFTDKKSGKGSSSNSSRASQSLDSVNKYIESTLLKDAPIEKETREDDRDGRIGPNVVHFDASARSGLLSTSLDRLSIKARSNFSTIRSNVAVYRGKWMYEVQLGSKGLMQIGWSTFDCKFTPDSGVGDTVNSYAYDGNRVRKWNVASYSYGESWLGGDVIGCAIDLDDGNVDFYRNGRNLGRAFENITMGSSFAYFPTVSLARTESLIANFGLTPMHYPLQGYEPMQAIPKEKILRATLLLDWFSKIIERVYVEEQKANGEKIMLRDDNMSVQAYLMCLANCVLVHMGPLITVPYIAESIILPFIQKLAESEDLSLLFTCLDLLWTFAEKHEMKECLETIIFFLLSTLRHVSHLNEYLDQCKSLILLTKICQHVSTRQYLLDNVLFDQARPPIFLDVKPPDKQGLIDTVSDVWWETKNPVDPIVEANKQSYLNACEEMKVAISELEKLQVRLLVTLLDNSDGTEMRPTSRTIFLRKFKRFIPIADADPAPITLCCIHRLLTAFQILWDAEVGTYPVYVPCRMFYDGSIDYSRTDRLGGVTSHLNKTFRNELIQLLGAEHETIASMESQAQNRTPNSYARMALVRAIDANTFPFERDAFLDSSTPPLVMNRVDSTTSLLELFDGIVSFYYLVAKKPLAKVALLRSSMTDYISASRDIKTRLEELDKKNSPESELELIRQQLSRLINIFNVKLIEQSRYMAWIRAAVYSEEKQLQFAWLLRAIAATLTSASLEGNMFSFVPDFYLETLADLCVGLRNHMHPTAPVERIADHQELFRSIAEFLCEHFMDPRIVSVNSKSTLLLMLAGFVFNPLTLNSLENVPEASRMKLVTSLLKSYENRAWAQSNWILVRFWQGNGFAFRYEKSPHLSKKIGARPYQQDSIFQPKKPYPSVVFQGHVRDVLLKSSQDTAAFLNSLLNLLNWTFSEFIGMVQEIHNVSSRPERVYIESRQLKICATCFDLSVSLLRILEMIITMLLCQVLNRMSSQTSCFQHVVQLEILDLECVDHFPILAAVTGILLALLHEDMNKFKRKSMTEVPKITQALLTEPSFQMSTLYFMLGDSKLKDRNQERRIKQFSFLNYPEDVTEEEVKRVKDMIEYLDECRAILPNSKISTDNSDTCTICYAQPIAVTFKPCNHQTCRICIDRHLLNSRSCFFCKVTIDKVVDLSGNVLHDFTQTPMSSN